MSGRFAQAEYAVWRALDYSIEGAKRIKDWPKLEEAVDTKIEEQHKFVAWWKANVTGQGTRTDLSRDLGESLPMREAEKLTGMRQQCVSELRQHLEDEARFRLRLLGVEFAGGRF